MSPKTALCYYFGYVRWIVLHLRYYDFLQIDFFVTNLTNENRFLAPIVPRILKCEHTYVRSYAYTSACVCAFVHLRITIGLCPKGKCCDPRLVCLYSR